MIVCPMKSNLIHKSEDLSIMSNSKKPESGLSFSASSDLKNVAISDILRNLVQEKP